MAKLTKSVHHALSLIAHASMAKKLDAEVFNANGASGFYDFWLKEQTPSDRAMLKTFSEIGRQAYVDLAKALEKDLSFEPSQGA